MGVGVAGSSGCYHKGDLREHWCDARPVLDLGQVLWPLLPAARCTRGSDSPSWRRLWPLGGSFLGWMCAVVPWLLMSVIICSPGHTESNSFLHEHSQPSDSLPLWLNIRGDLLYLEVLQLVPSLTCDTKKCTSCCRCTSVLRYTLWHNHIVPCNGLVTSTSSSRTSPFVRISALISPADSASPDMTIAAARNSCLNLLDIFGWCPWNYLFTLKLWVWFVLYSSCILTST